MQVFTCVGALAIGGALESSCRQDTLAWWLCERQTPGGGLNGRPQKDADVCYSWWVSSRTLPTPTISTPALSLPSLHPPSAPIIAHSPRSPPPFFDLSRPFFRTCLARHHVDSIRHRPRFPRMPRAITFDVLLIQVLSSLCLLERVEWVNGAALRNFILRCQGNKAHIRHM